MTKDLTGELWDLFPPYQRHSETSYDAAESIEPNSGTIRAKVLDKIRSRGDHGATDEDLQSWLRLEGSTERPRRVELVKLGLIEASKEKRKTRTGRWATIWLAK